MSFPRDEDRLVSVMGDSWEEVGYRLGLVALPLSEYAFQYEWQKAGDDIKAAWKSIAERAREGVGQGWTPHASKLLTGVERALKELQADSTKGSKLCPDLYYLLTMYEIAMFRFAYHRLCSMCKGRILQPPRMLCYVCESSYCVPCAEKHNKMCKRCLMKVPLKEKKDLHDTGSDSDSSDEEDTSSARKKTLGSIKVKSHTGQHSLRRSARVMLKSLGTSPSAPKEPEPTTTPSLPMPVDSSQRSPRSKGKGAPPRGCTGIACLESGVMGQTAELCPLTFDMGRGDRIYKLGLLQRTKESDFFTPREGRDESSEEFLTPRGFEIQHSCLAYDVGGSLSPLGLNSQGVRFTLFNLYHLDSSYDSSLPALPMAAIQWELLLNPARQPLSWVRPLLANSLRFTAGSVMPMWNSSLVPLRTKKEDMKDENGEEGEEKQPRIHGEDNLHLSEAAIVEWSSSSFWSSPPSSQGELVRANHCIEESLIKAGGALPKNIASKERMEAVKRSAESYAANVKRSRKGGENEGVRWGSRDEDKEIAVAATRLMLSQKKGRVQNEAVLASLILEEKRLSVRLRTSEKIKPTLLKGKWLEFSLP